MKSEPMFSAMLVCCVLIFSSCKKDDATTSPTSPTSTGGAFSFTVDGSTITVDSAYAVLYTLGVPPNNREIDVYAFKGGLDVLEFHFLPRTGSQTAGQNFTGAWLTYRSSPTVQFDSQSGALSLTTCDTTGNRIQGTFSFVGVQLGGTATKAITGGNLLVTRMTRQ